MDLKLFEFEKLHVSEQSVFYPGRDTSCLIYTEGNSA